MTAVRLLMAAVAVVGATPVQHGPHTRAEVEQMAAHWQTVYPVSPACVVAIAERAAGPTFDSRIRNLGDFEPGAAGIWALSRDWRDERLDPDDVDDGEQIRVVEAIIVEYPAEARQAWAPFPASCAA